MDEKVKKNLNSLWLIAMVMYTPIVAMCLNFDVFNARIIPILLTWVILLLLPYVLIKKKFLYKIAVSLLFADGFVNLFHWIILKCPLNASSIFVFMNTNFSEASEFMTIKMSPLLLLLIPLVYLFVMAIRNVPGFSLKSKAEKIIWPVAWIYMIVFLADNIINDCFVRLAVPDVERAFVSFFEESKAYKKLKKRDLYDLDAKLTTKDSTLFVVLVGESCNRNHMSLYGYKRATTPRLQSRNDIYVFDNVISAYSNTLKAILNMLSENNTERNMSIDTCVNVFDVFHSTAYKTYWLSNQSPIGIWDNGVYNLAQNADNKIFNVTSSSSMETLLTASYDEDLISPLEIAMDEKVKNKLIFLHLMGSHTKYSKRYPLDFVKFKEHTNDVEEVINSYDNSIYYTDFLVDSIFSLMNDYCKSHPDVRISCLFFSDHGENVYDDGDYAGHDFSGAIPDANIEIPFVFWFSDSQKAYLKEHSDVLCKDVHTPYMTDDLFHTIIDICNVSVGCFDETRSFVNKNYYSGRRRLLDDGNIYKEKP